MESTAPSSESNRSSLPERVRDQLLGARERFPTPCFVLLMDEVDRRVDELDAAFGGRFGLSYAVKANPNPALLSRLAERIPHLDISSAGELRRGIAAGWQPQRISFTGPGKTDSELQAAVESEVGEVIVESLHEAQRLDSFAAAAGRRQRVLIRIAPHTLPPGFGAQMAGRPSIFGVDEEVLDDMLAQLTDLQHLQLVGFHVFAGAQCLNAEAIAQSYVDYMRIFRHACEVARVQPEKLVFGSGLGIPYHDHEQDLDLTAIAQVVIPELDRLRAEFPDTTFLLELGRFLVGQAGFYLARVITKKDSRGATFCLLDGGMNHNLAACGLLGMVIPRNYRFFKLASDTPDGPEQTFQLVGPLCTSLDTLGRNVALPGLEVGDVVAMGGAGAYGATASPVHFISHALPTEVLVETGANGTIYDEQSWIRS